MSSRHISWVQHLSWTNLVKIFRNFKHTVGMYYPSKHFVTDALVSALVECTYDELIIIYTKLNIVPPNTKSTTQLRLQLLNNVTYLLYGAPIKLWNVVMTSGLSVVILGLIEKLLYGADLQDVIVMNKIMALIRIAYVTIGSVALATIFFRWLKSKQLRNRVIHVLDYIEQHSNTPRNSKTRVNPKTPLNSKKRVKPNTLQNSKKRVKPNTPRNSKKE